MIGALQKVAKRSDTERNVVAIPAEGFGSQCAGSAAKVVSMLSPAPAVGRVREARATAFDTSIGRSALSECAFQDACPSIFGGSTVSFPHDQAARKSPGSRAALAS